MKEWFLPAAAPGSPDEWCFQTIPTAEIRVHTNYWGYNKRLANLFSRAKGPNEEIFLVGWAFSLDGLRALRGLEAARGRRARVRVLTTRDHSWSVNSSQVELARKKNLEAELDDQLPPPPPSDVITHHQKAAFIKLEKNSHLFVGGMDVTTGRMGEWIDLQVEVIGHGANLGRITLEERWDSKRAPVGGSPPSRQALNPSGKGGAHQVQFVRTYPPFPTDPTGWKRNFAKEGDYTYYALLSRAITKAKSVIYLEEHLFSMMAQAPRPNCPPGGSTPRKRSDLPDLPQTIQQLLKQAIARGVKLVAVGPGRRPAVVAELENPKNPPVLLCLEPLAPWTDGQEILSVSKPPEKPDLLRRVADMVFHSKTWIFDDEFVVVGSANLWDRSLVNGSIPPEAEFGVAFTSSVDGEPLGFAGMSFAEGLRRTLWERIRQTFDPSYVFPRALRKDFPLPDQIKELTSPVGGMFPFRSM